MQPPRRKFVVRFGLYEADLDSGEMRKAGLKIQVQQQPLKVLAALLEHPGEVVSREELRSRIWPSESFGDFDQAVNVAVAKLRSALGDSADNPRFIETLSKRGYRFIADVMVIEGEPSTSKPEAASQNLRATEPVTQLPGTGLAAAPKRQPTRWLIAAVAVVVGLLILAVRFFRPSAGPPKEIRSLAVLPLENLAGDESQDYFADGITDELITDLGQISALRVVSRTSVMPYKRARKSLPQIARELNVDAVVEGTVLRSGEQVRITAQLIEAPADKHLWAKSYEGDLRDTLALQKRVASAIAEQIRIELTPQERSVLKKAKTVNPEAYEVYLKGRYFWNKRTANGLKRAVDYFDQAIEKDPTYAQAYAGLADSYALLGDWEYGVLSPTEAFPKAKAAATKALELDDNLSEAHTSLAFYLLTFEWNWTSAEREFKRAIELNPGYATAHHWYAWHLTTLGRNGEAIAEMKKAETLDPLSLIISSDMADVLLIAHRYDESVKESKKTIDMDPSFALAHYQLGKAYVQMHQYDEAIAELKKSVELSGGSATCNANLAYAYALSGRRSEATKILKDVQTRSTHGVSNASEIALIYAGLGDKDTAMMWLQKAYAEHFNPSILQRPAFDPLRSDRRFEELVRRIGLPLTPA